MLTFNLKKEWFEKIKSGEKTHEYRVSNSYWDKRLYKYFWTYQNRYDLSEFLICFACGYPRKSDKEKRIYAKMRNIKIVIGRNTDLKIDKPVYDIEFELIGNKDD